MPRTVNGTGQLRQDLASASTSQSGSSDSNSDVPLMSIAEIRAAYQREQAAANDDAAPTPAPSDGAEQSSSSDSSSDEEISSDSDSDDDCDPSLRRRRAHDGATAVITFSSPRLLLHQSPHIKSHTKPTFL